ncbi:MAG: P-loop NTPase [Promethearchaeota archaeon]
MSKKHVGIISGKGGVGKTSLTASLAILASQDPEFNVMVLDCDVDAPNLAFLLPKDSSEEDRKDVFATLKAKFIEDKCIHCKKCIDEHFCEFNALSWDEEANIPIIDYISCEGCNACKVLCPETAFEIYPVKSGEIISYKTKYDFNLAYGKTRLGSTTSGKLVTDVKQHAQALPVYEDINLVLIDGPPGIGCPVIAMLTGLDYVITITEPTPSGLHDLIRAIEVVNQFNIPFGIVINKADLESPFQDEFKNFMEETKYPLLGSIDFDISVPESLSMALPLVIHDPKSKASKQIEKIYEKLREKVLEL